MPNNLRHKDAAPVEHLGTSEQWRIAAKNIRKLGAQFVAIYGAEPLDRMGGLPEMINNLRAEGIAVTVITALPASKRMRTLLETSSLNSVTVSYDALDDADASDYSDSHRRAKSTAGWKMLERNDQIMDRAVVATITQDNVDDIPEMARRATERGYWFMFDLLHDDIGVFGKCGRGGPLQAPTKEQGHRMAQSLLDLKSSGMKIHASEQFLTKMRDEYNGNPREFWHCRGESTGWLTVDADGSIMPCDDWQKAYPSAKIWDDIDAEDLSAWKDSAVNDCAGCAWNTHWDACAIERGEIPLGTYVHD